AGHSAKLEYNAAQAVMAGLYRLCETTRLASGVGIARDAGGFGRGGTPGHAVALDLDRFAACRLEGQATRVAYVLGDAALWGAEDYPMGEAFVGTTRACRGP